MSGTMAKAKLRIVRFLSGGKAARRGAAKAGTILLDSDERGTIAAPEDVLRTLIEDGILNASGKEIALSGAGIAWLKRAQASIDPMREQHVDLARAQVETDDGPDVVIINLAESPLAQLARRKAKDGRGFLAAVELRAGERLRADYTRAQIMPRLGVNWQAAVSSGRRSGGAADLTDAALAARQRVDKAIGAVGPELAGVLLDVCCFLKGLETVESERGWPARSAKVLLKAALAALGRHYEPPTSRTTGKAVLHWGSEGYRRRYAALDRMERFGA